jgi:hypothetical protein
MKKMVPVYRLDYFNSLHNWSFYISLVRKQSLIAYSRQPKKPSGEMLTILLATKGTPTCCGMKLKRIFLNWTVRNPMTKLLILHDKSITIYMFKKQSTPVEIISISLIPKRHNGWIQTHKRRFIIPYYPSVNYWPL